MLRIAFIGVSHWHAPLYFVPAARLPHVEIVAVSDPSAEIVESVGRQLGARAFTDYRELIADARPDFVFAFGRHCDMAEICHALIDEKLPFVIEKPGGMNSGEVSAVRDAAAKAGIHAGAGFNFRTSDLYDKLVDIVGDDTLTHASFRYIAGGPYRYRADNSEWMLDPTLSGGGSTINLSVHFIDMFRTLSRSHPAEVTSLMGNFTWKLPIEDYSSLIMRSDTSVCTVETGYTYPVHTHGVFDLRFSLRTTRHYLIVRNDNVLQVQKSADGLLREYELETSNLHMYPDFVTDSIDRFQNGQPPIASLDDLAGAVEVVDAAFASSKRGAAADRKDF